MSDHLSIATEGLAPSVFSHKLFASLGFGFDVEVIITPKPLDTGGGSGSIPDLREYLITVKVTRKGKVWVKSIEANQFELKTLEKVLITFKKINTIVENISIQIKNSMIQSKNIIVNIFNK